MEFDGAFFNCLVGRDGLTADKHEGDWKTPVGCFNITGVMYRADRMGPFKCAFNLESITSDDGWCDDPKSPEYNQMVKLPYEFSAESLWRDDDLYDIIVVLDYNSDPVVPGRGSAIFIHVAKEGMEYTKGCTALNKADLVDLLASVGPETQICIEP